MLSLEFEKCVDCLNRYVSQGVQMCCYEDTFLENCNPNECEDMRYLED